MLAAAYNHVDIIDLLMLGNWDKESKSLNEEDSKNYFVRRSLLLSKDDRGWTALVHAQRSCHQGAVEALQRYTQQLNAGDENCGMSPLMVAAFFGDVNTVKEILKQEQQEQQQQTTILQVAEGNGMTALHFAAEGCHPKVVRLLLNATKGKGLDQVDRCKRTPLMITTQICCKVKVHTPDDDKGKNRHMECMTELLIGTEEQGSNRDLSLAYVNHNIKRDDYGEVQTDGTFSSECLWQLENFPEERRL